MLEPKLATSIWVSHPNHPLVFQLLLLPHMHVSHYPKQTGFHIIKLEYVEYVRALCFPAPRTSNLKHGELECYESTTPMPSWSSPMSACFDHLDSRLVKPQGGGNQEVGIEFMVVVNVQITVQTEKQLVRLWSKHAVLLVARCYNLCASHSNQFNTHKA